MAVTVAASQQHPGHGSTPDRSDGATGHAISSRAIPPPPRAGGAMPAPRPHPLPRSPLAALIVQQSHPDGSITSPGYYLDAGHTSTRCPFTMGPIGIN